MNKEMKKAIPILRRGLAGILAAVLLFGNVSPAVPYAYAEENFAEEISEYIEEAEAFSEELPEETAVLPEIIGEEPEVTEEPTEAAAEETEEPSSEEMTSEEPTEEETTEEATEEDPTEETTSEEASEEAPTEETTSEEDPTEETLEDISLLAADAIVAEGECGPSLHWALHDNGWLDITGSGKMTSAPWDKASVESLSITEDITSICDYAFKDCSNIVGDIDLSGSALVSIGKEAFRNCYGLSGPNGEGNATVNLSNCINLTSIDTQAFKNCGMKHLDLSGCTSLTDTGKDVNSDWEGGTFSSCGWLETADLSGCTSLSKISAGSFLGDSELTSINLDECFPKTDGTIENVIGEYAFYNCKKLENVDNLNWKNLTRIKGHAFQNCSSFKDALDFSESTELIEIDSGAFSNSGVTGLDLSNCTNLKSISGSAFQDCKKLEYANFSGCKNLLKIGDKAFLNCSAIVGDINLSDCTIESIGEEAFHNCSGLSGPNGEGNATVNLSNCTNLTSIDTRAFKNCGMKHLDLSGCTSLTDTGKDVNSDWQGGTFSSCGWLETADLSGCTSLSKISAGSFLGDSELTSINLDECFPKTDGTIENVIGEYAFYDCKKLENVDNLNWKNLTRIKGHAFQNCSSFKDALDFSESTELIEIDSGAFSNSGVTGLDLSNCTNLKSIYGSAFQDCKKLEYANFSGCKNLLKIGDKAFLNCSAIVGDINLSDCTIESIGEEAFHNCSGLSGPNGEGNATVNLSKCTNLTSIGSQAFNNCGMKHLDLSDCTSLTDTGKDVISDWQGGTFGNCGWLETADLSGCSSLSKISAGSFCGDSELTSINLDECFPKTDGTIENVIGEYAFYDCKKLENVDNLNWKNLTRIKGHAFQNCSSFKDALDFSESTELIEIDSSAFSNSGVTGLDLSNCTNLKSIYGSAFQDCKSLTGTINLSDCPNLRTIGENAFKGSAVETITIHGTTGKNAYATNIVEGKVDNTIPVFNIKNAFIGMSKLKTVDLSGSQIPCISESAFSGDTAITKVDMRGCTRLSYIDKTAFNGDTAITKVDMRGCTSLSHIDKTAFNGCSNLRELTIPDGLTNMADTAFKGCSAVEDLVWNAKDMGSLESFEGFSPLKASFASGFRLHIGNAVVSLPTAFFTAMSACGDIFFEGENEKISIHAQASAKAPAPICDIDGTCYVDSFGVVFEIEQDSTGTSFARVVYCPPELTEYTVPTTVNGGIPVTQVADSAFILARDLKKVSFADASQIKPLGSSAFYGVEALCEVTDEKTGRSATTVADALELFTPAAPASAFRFTGLDDAQRKNPWDGGTPSDGKTSIQKGIKSGDKKTNLVLTGTLTTKNVTWDADAHALTMLTGEQAEMIFSVSNQSESESEQTGYIFIHMSNSGITGLDPEFNLIDENQIVATAKLIRTADPDIYCIAVKLGTGKTGSFTMTLSYPSPQSAGGDVHIWLQDTVSDSNAPAPEDLKESDQFYHFSWGLKRLEREVAKKTPSKCNPNAVGDSISENLAYVNWLTWKINLSSSNKSEVRETEGKDYSTQVRFSDLLELPRGVYWNEQDLEAIQEGNTEVITSGNKHSFYAGDKLLISVTGKAIYDLTVSPETKDGKTLLRINWVSNRAGKNAEVDDDDTISLTVQSTALIVKLDELTDSGKPPLPYTINDLKNNVSAQVFYSHSGTKTLESSVTDSIEIPAANMKIEKARQADRGERMNGVFSYNLHAHNDGVGSTTEVTSIYDELDSYLMILPEDMERMFAEEDGDRLTVRIRDARASEPFTTPVTSITGEKGGAHLTNLNSGPAASPLGTLIIEKDGAGYAVFLEETGERFHCSRIAEGLAHFNYEVSRRDVYKVTWRISTDDHPFSWPGGLQKDFPIYSSVKSTLQALEEDKPYHYNYNNGQWIHVYNVCNLVHGSTTINAANLSPFQHELTIGKGVSANTNGTYESGKTVLTYSITVTNDGRPIAELPVTDEMSGNLLLLAPKEPNKNADWVGSVEERTIGNTAYYVFNQPGEYKTVWVSNGSTALYCADTVTVSETVNLFGTHTGWETNLHWYYPEFKKTSSSIQYQAVLDFEGKTYSYSNTAYLNERENDRLYATVANGGGYALSGSKDIVTANPNLDGTVTGETLSKFSVLTELNHKATYKLTVSNTTKEFDFVLTADNLMDQLPKTYGCFQWNHENLSLTYRTEGDVTLSGMDDWYITTVPPIADWGTSEDQQYIRWKDGSSQLALLKPGSSLILYITLDFSVDDWETFARTVNSRELVNTMYLNQYPHSVSHEVREKQKIVLQQGVSRITQIGLTDSKKFYNNTESHIEYYVTLYNGGFTRMYLDDLEVTLPEKFTFRNLGAAPGSYSINGTSYNEICTVYGSGANLPQHPVSTADSRTENLKYRAAYVSAATVSGKTIFRFRGLYGNEWEKATFINYNATLNKYYLNPGEALAFCYVCDIPRKDSLTADSATSRITMKVYDPDNAGVSVYPDVCITSSDRANTVAPNDGTHALVQSGTVKQLLSDVTVYQDSILPGIQKNLKSYTYENKEYTLPQKESIVPPQATINWTVSVFNDHQRDIDGYTLEDTMQYPYRVSGKVFYSTFDGNVCAANVLRSEDSVSTVPLFTVYERDEENKTVKIQDMNGKIYELDTTKGDKVNLPVNFIREYNNGVYRSAYDSQWNTSGAYAGDTGRKNCTVTVSFRYNDADQSETMRIVFPAKTMVLMPGQTGVLDVSTSRVDIDYQNTAYVNSSRFIPADLSYEPFLVTKGTPLQDENGKNMGVESSATVNVATGYATIGVLQVADADDENNTPSSQDGALVLPAKENNRYHNIRYTMSVQFVNSMTETDTIDRLVLISNLPQTDDAYTLRSDIPRYSEYQVGFADDPNVVVKVLIGGTETVLEPDQYTLEYSSETSFSDDAWKGAASDSWGAQAPGSRSVRIVLNQDKVEMPMGCTVEVSYSAKVNDENAQPGMEANNSFAYNYEVNGITLQASPLLKTVRLSNYPYLQKQLVDAQNNPLNAEEDLTFPFLVYTGEPLDGQFATDEDLKNAVSADNRASHIFTIIIPKGASQSEMLRLVDTEDWKWIPDQQYTITELTAYRNYRFDRWVSGSDTFIFRPGMTQLFLASNMDRRWNIELTKVSEQDPNLKLDDAVFGLYSPNILDQMSAEELEKKEIQGPLTIEENGQTWYLADIKATKSGIITWKDVTEDTYILSELKAPDGYHYATGLIAVSRYSVGADKKTAAITVTNRPSYRIPGTGGIGNTPFFFAGLMLLLAAAFTAMQRKKKYSM